VDRQHDPADRKRPVIRGDRARGGFDPRDQLLVGNERGPAGQDDLDDAARNLDARAGRGREGGDRRREDPGTEERQRFSIAVNARSPSPR
jgi:hypothetical protein